jgi:hypothetical protein
MARGLRRVFLKAFSAGLAANAALTRSRFRVLEQRVLTPAFVAVTKWVRGSKAVAPNAAAIGTEWERLLASKKTAHLTSVEPPTASAPRDGVRRDHRALPRSAAPATFTPATA